MKYFIPTATAFILCLLACNTKDTKPGEAIKPDFVFENLDTTMNPGTDFFQYANGGWIKKNPIPADQSSWGIGNLVIEENIKRLREISESAALAPNSIKGSADQMIGDFWTAGMDSAKIEHDGLKYLQPYLTLIEEAKDLPALINVVTELKKIGSGAFFADFVAQDDKNSDAMAYIFYQGGIGLPEREYYFKNDSATINIREKYADYISKMLQLTGHTPEAAIASGKNILSMETKFAQGSRKIEDLRDPYANYNKMAINQLNKISPVIDLQQFLNKTGVKNIDSVIVGQPDFFKSMNTVVKATPLATLKDYVRFKLVSDFASALPNAYVNTSFEYSKLFSGATEMRPRWKRVMSRQENLIGEILGQLYVKEFFTPVAKKRYEVMTEAVREALRDRIGQLTWMSDSTKIKAYSKLDAITSKVGYPEKWKDFSAMNISKESYLQNIIEGNKWWNEYELNKLGKPVDRTEWTMTPQTYNAYYNPSNNEIVLPAGIFTVPGYRDEELDDAIVYGNGGASTIGHEITHGFDDQGRQYDAKGNLSSWWNAEDEKEFNRRAKVMIDQFSDYEPLPGYKINGEATLGENIADLGGALLGLEAFKKTNQYKDGKPISGLMPTQRYFLGYALGWLGQTRDETLRSSILSDVHSPGKYRVNGPFANMEAFYEAFQVKPGDAMYRPDSLRVNIW
ncbi:MAG: M13 family metallopeptidase [Saprospiraceae bacterium]|nr:M13 family metallopeptidase [Saprospiraceae bacterium]